MVPSLGSCCCWAVGETHDEMRAGWATPHANKLLPVVVSSSHDRGCGPLLPIRSWSRTIQRLTDTIVATIRHSIAQQRFPTGLLYASRAS